MSRFLTGLLAAAALAAVLTPIARDAEARGRGFHGRHYGHFTRHHHRLWRGGHWWHGRRHGRFAWWWVADGYWFAYPGPIYPYPTYVPPAVAVLPPRSYAPPPAYSGPPPAQHWYHCANPRGYYPYVRSCRGPWQAVPATPPAGSAPRAR